MLGAGNAGNAGNIGTMTGAGAGACTSVGVEPIILTVADLTYVIRAAWYVPLEILMVPLALPKE